MRYSVIISKHSSIIQDKIWLLHPLSSFFGCLQHVSMWTQMQWYKRKMFINFISSSPIPQLIELLNTPWKSRFSSLHLYQEDVVLILRKCCKNFCVAIYFSHPANNIAELFNYTWLLMHVCTREQNKQQATKS
jgi:hypothetical protein